LSELVEEHTVFTKKLLTRLIQAIIALHVLLWLFDGFPLRLCLLSVVSHVVYAQNLRRFPIIKLTEPVFLLSCALVLLNHYLWFQQFQRPISHHSADAYASTYGDTEIHASFNEVSSFFGLGVWLVPFALFIALSAGDNVLPSIGSEYATGEGSSFVTAGRESNSTPNSTRNGSGGREGLAKATVNAIREWVGEASSIVGWRSSADKRKF